MAGGNDCPGGKAVDIGYNASTIGLDDPTLDALGQCRQRNSHHQCRSEWHLRASDSNPRTTGIQVEVDFLRESPVPLSSEISSPLKRELRLIQYGVIQQGMEQFRETSRRQLLIYHLNYTKRDRLAQPVFLNTLLIASENEPES